MVSPSEGSSDVSIENFIDVLLRIRARGAHGPGLQYIRRAIMEQVEDYDILEVPVWLYSFFSSLLGTRECIEWQQIPDSNWSNVCSFLTEICEQGALHLVDNEYEDCGEEIKFKFEHCEREGVISIESNMFMTQPLTGQGESSEVSAMS